MWSLRQSVREEGREREGGRSCVILSPAHSTQGSAESRTRYWNAYMLFYEEVKKSKSGLAPPLIRGGETIPRSPISPLPEGGDKLTQLQVSTLLRY